MSKSWYMHTIDGKPAYFAERNGQICFAMKRQNFPILVESLALIRRQQVRTKLYRLHQGCLDNSDDYGYITFPKATVKRAATKPRKRSRLQRRA